MRLARKGEGVRIIEIPAAQPEQTEARGRAAPRARARVERAVDANPLSPFSDAELLRIAGVEEELVGLLRALPPSIDIGESLASRLADPDLAALLTDLWERPGRHVELFSEGRVPSLADVTLAEAEVSGRIGSEDSATELVETGGEAQIRRLLDRSIEEWMVYLHPTQRAIANATFTGPARVRGGPGTGKTVVALHRARVLARHRVAPGDRVLLTTFLNTLPKVWQSLMGLLDSMALQQLDIRNVDALARSVVASSRTRVELIDDARRRTLAATLVRRHGLDHRIGDNHQLLLDEFDAFLSGRGIETLKSYLALRRRGGGSPLGRADRERVRAADRGAPIGTRGGWPTVQRRRRRRGPGSQRGRDETAARARREH
jgi:hypothetical protein